MICVDSVIEERLPAIAAGSPRVRNTVSALLRYLFHEAEFKQFERDYPYLQGFDFVDKVLEYFEFDYATSTLERERIPVTGRVVIIANHPIGSLDGLALLKLVGEVRRDVKVVANELLYSLAPLRPLLLPVDNMGGKTTKQNLRAIEQHLCGDGAVIIFPAGEVSRVSPAGIRDGRWRQGFLRYALKTQSPVLPIHISARNSLFFYALSLLAKPLSTLWLIREMFKQSHRTVRVSIGPAVACADVDALPLSTAGKIRLFKKHVYQLGSRRRHGRGLPGLLPQLQSVAHPENRQQLRAEIRQCERLGSTRDGMEIYCYRYRGDSAVMRELGRLREISFRAVGEGSGRRRDIDQFDSYYDHILLWDDSQLELVGAYRLLRAAALEGEQQLYSQTLFDYLPAAKPYLQQGLELGRSFVQPRYWGKQALDYLWQGVGTYLKRHPDIRYLFGPVSLSNELPREARDRLVAFYGAHFAAQEPWATAKRPYQVSEPTLAYAGNDYKREFAQLKEELLSLGTAVPTLYKQYTELCEPGGVCFAGFNVDPDFADCIDGLVLVDIEQMKSARRKRYLGEDR